MSAMKPDGWMHIQGNYSEPALRPVDETETARGWTQEPLYTLATVRKWLEDESFLAQMWWKTDTGPEAIYRDMLAAKLREMEDGE